MAAPTTPKAPATPKAPEAPKAPETTATPKAPKAPIVPAKIPDGYSLPGFIAKRRKYPGLDVIFKSEEEALAEAGKREKGPRRAFKTECGGKTIYVVTDNPSAAGAIGFINAGGKVTELGRAEKGVKAMGLDAIMAAVAALPESERVKVMESLKLKK